MSTGREKRAMRDAFGDTLVELGREDKRIVALTADLAEAVRVHHFAEEFPTRFFQMGIAENDMIGTAAGLAIGGKIPIATTFSIFAVSLANQPIRLSVAYNKLNVKICVSHGGVTVGGDGATHQAFEDLALMRMIPGMTVVIPADAHEAAAATRAIVAWEGPVYCRFGRIASPVFTPEDQPFDIRRAPLIRSGDDVAIFAAGLMVAKAISAAEQLSDEGIEATVVNVHTIKPLDLETVDRVAASCGCAVSAEEHSILGGLGGALAERFSETTPIPLERVGVRDTFGESGEPEEILKKYGLTSQEIVRRARKVVDRKRRRREA